MCVCNGIYLSRAALYIVVNSAFDKCIINWKLILCWLVLGISKNFIPLALPRNQNRTRKRMLCGIRRMSQVWLYHFETFNQIIFVQNENNSNNKRIIILFMFWYVGSNIRLIYSLHVSVLIYQIQFDSSHYLSTQ